MCNFGQDWETGYLTSVHTQYKALLTSEIKASVGVHIGLRSVNITLLGKYLQTKSHAYPRNIWFNWLSSNWGAVLKTSWFKIVVWNVITQRHLEHSVAALCCMITIFAQILTVIIRVSSYFLFLCHFMCSSGAIFLCCAINYWLTTAAWQVFSNVTTVSYFLCISSVRELLVMSSLTVTTSPTVQLLCISLTTFLPK